MTNSQRFFAGLALLVICNSCHLHHPALVRNDEQKDSIGAIEILDPAGAALIDSLAKIVVIGRHYQWSEGPVWVAARHMLLFSDVRANTIFSWKLRDTPVAYLSPSGYTDTAIRHGENGSNGLALDQQGRLLLCQSGNRQVVRMNGPIDSPGPSFTVLSARYRGKRFNSPNDLVESSKGCIYFTDPIYGLPLHEKDPTREMNFEGVFKIDADGKTSLLIDSIKRPNGIALSLNEKILYIGSTDEGRPGWYAYQLDENGKIRSGGLLLDARPMERAATIRQGGDGFKIDRQGNLFASGPDGVNLISPEGKLLARIHIFKRPVSNCAFNETKDTLYITADDLVLRVNLH